MYHAIVFLPLVGFLIAGCFGRWIGVRASEVVTTALLFLSCFLSWIAFADVAFGTGATRVQVTQWMVSGDLVVDWAFRIDTLTVVMLIVVTTVSALVHLYSIGYMAEDPHRPRFFAYLSLFTFAMLMLVTADNLVQLFFGWEGVGLASYLLIGFWYLKDSANNAAIKAFIVNRVGDFGFALGIFLVFVLFGTVALESIFPRVGEVAGASFRFLGYDWHALTLACLLLFMGAMGKSAQFLLHTWLPDAMEGPTPVSALIHAATMVTAGVFMVARLSPLFEAAPAALSVVAVIGGITCFFAATIGLVQNDIKKVVAYSTCSQLGYMFVGLGVGAYATGIFHLVTHASFKALLFLCSGSVITAMHHEQDMRRMGGLRRYIPFTAATMLVGSLALTGFPGTAGYFSKDAIIAAAYVSPVRGATFAYLASLTAVALTAFYTWRLFFMTFEGAARWGGHATEHDAGATGAAHGADEAAGHAGEAHDHVPHESPWTMLVPLGVLSVGALLAGFVGEAYFIGHDQAAFWQGSLGTGPDEKILEQLHHLPFWIEWAPTLMMLFGFLVALWFYILDTRKPAQLAAQQPLLYQLLLNKWYFDELYDAIFVRPAMRLGHFLWRKGDGWLIDGFGPDGVAARVIDMTRGAVRLETGYVYHYAFAMLIGVAAFISWYLVAGAQ